MIALPLGATRVDEALRVVRALGSHRYVAGRLHLVHAFAFSALPEGSMPALAAGREWGRTILGDPAVDAGSRDERLWRRCSDDEVVALFDAYWSPRPTASPARQALRYLLQKHDLAISDGALFDESIEQTVHPILIDAGWELVPLGHLDPERHKGAMAAFDDRSAFESARVAEERAHRQVVPLCELPAIGAAELLRGAGDDGLLAAPLVVWIEGNETYLDYVIRGVRRAAKV